MKRLKLTQLIAWKNSPTRKPLVLRGARQVGKTWLLKEFGATEYQDFVYINFEKNTRMQALFDQDFDLKRKTVNLFMVLSNKVREPEITNWHWHG